MQDPKFCIFMALPFRTCKAYGKEKSNDKQYFKKYMKQLQQISLIKIYEILNFQGALVTLGTKELPRLYLPKAEYIQNSKQTVVELANAKHKIKKTGISFCSKRTSLECTKKKLYLSEQSQENNSTNQQNHHFDCR